jgi:hypothetical protein
MVEPMAFSAETPNRAQGLSLGSAGRAPFESGDWIEPEKEPRDWKKLFLVLGLGALSWVATYVGMLELIESNMGDLPLTQEVIIGFAVAMLMTMIIWLLDQIFSPISLTTKIVYIFGYLFLTLISVGFGFGFYWKVLESRGETTRSAEAAISQVQTALHAGSTRIEQLSETLEQLTVLSASKAVEEREKGTSCPNSRPGDGPRRKLRDADAQTFAFAGDFVKGRVGAIRGEIAGLDAELKKVVDSAQSTIDPKSGNRNEFMRSLNRRLDMTVAGFNAFRTDPQLGQIRSDLAARAEQTVFPDGSGRTYACPDAQLQTALRGVVRAIDQLPEMQRPQVAALEGSEATVEAFRRLAATLQGALVFELPPSADELRALQKKAVQSVSETAARAAAPVLSQPVGLSKRDYIPLAIAVFVDFCLLLVSIGRPVNRLSGLVPLMREAERGPMIKILSRFNDIHRDPEIRQNFEVFRHVVFDMHGAYYVAVPLDAPYRPNGGAGQGGFGYGSNDAQELQHEAHLLANLFSGFERQKIFTRVYNPFLSTKAIQKKLWRQGSKFAGCNAFRIYRFRDGAWSDMILQAVMGAARRAEEQRRLRPSTGPGVTVEPRGKPPEPPANDQDPLHGFDTGLKLTPEPDALRNGAELNRVRPAAAAYEANGVSRRLKRRRMARPKQDTLHSRQEENSLRSAFGRYAPSAAAEFSHEFCKAGTDAEDSDEGGNVASINRIGQHRPTANASPESVASRKKPVEPERAENGGEVVVSLSDKRQSGVSAADVEFILAPQSREEPTSGAAVQQTLSQKPAEEDESHTTVTLMRETATFEMPVSDRRLSAALSAAAHSEQQALRNADETGPISLPPLPKFAGEAQQETVLNSVECNNEDPDKDGTPVGLHKSAVPFLTFEDEDADDPTVVTIARRLRPDGPPSGS